jgi:penicillin-binding protein 2
VSKRKVGIFGIGTEGHSSDKKLKLNKELSKAEEWNQVILPADATAEASEDYTNKSTLITIAVIVTALSILMIGRLIVLQIIDGTHNLSIADGNLLRSVNTRAPRGIIYDSSGNIIAKNIPAYDITVTPSQLPRDKNSLRTIYESVGKIIGMSEQDVRSKANLTCSTEIACSLSYEPQLVKPNISQEQALLFEQESANLKGFALDVNAIRHYDDVGSLLSPFLGYTGRINPTELSKNSSYQPNDLVGKGGLEGEYEPILRGRDGANQTEVDATGKPIKTLASVPATAGKNIQLTIDQGLEAEMAKDIEAEMKASNSHRAAGVAINPNTGAILASVSLPTYDNNSFAKGISQSEYNALLANPGQPLFDKVIDGEYPSGSIIKPLSASAALQENVITPTTVINDRGKLVVPNENDASAPPAVYNGWDVGGLGPMTVLSAIAQSSDIFFYTIAGGFNNLISGSGYTNFPSPLGISRLTHYLNLFGLGSRTGVDVPDENAGVIPTPAWKNKVLGESWYLGDTYNTSIGQGDLLVTPLQMAMATSVIANGGNLLKPYFVQKVTDSLGNTIKETIPQIIRSGFVSPQNLAVVRQGMLETTQNNLGTGCCKIRTEVPVLVGAKTGSAQTDTAVGGVPEAWFSAFAPYNNPQIVIIIFVEKAGEGADFAAPAARSILTYYFTAGAGAKYVTH